MKRKRNWTKSGKEPVYVFVFLLTIKIPKLIKHKRLVATTMKAIFGIESVEDYTLHEPPDPSSIRLFIQEEIGGPDENDLRIDMTGKIASLWNTKVMEILLDAVLTRKGTGTAWEDLPDRSNDYFAEIIRDHVQRARTTWRNAQPRLLDSGEVESLAAVEERMIESKDISEKMKRANTRRLSVRLPIFCVQLFRLNCIA